MRVVLGAAGAALIAAAVAGASTPAGGFAMRTAGDRFSASPSISADGRFVAFESHASNLVAGDTNGRNDVFVRDRLARRTTRVSVSSRGAQGNEMSSARAISADGRFVVFSSYASNLAPVADPPPIFGSDVLLRDRTTATTTVVSVARGGGQANENSGAAAVSADGRLVAFVSLASNLAAGGTNKCKSPWSGSEQKLYDCRHVFVRDRATGRTTQVSVSSNGRQSNGESDDVAISANGRYVAFSSVASNLVARDTSTCVSMLSPGSPKRYNCRDVFVRDRVRRTTERASVGAGAQRNGPTSSQGSYQPAISADGRYVAFVSDASNLVPGDTNHFVDVFVRDRKSRTTTRVSVSGAGKQANGPSFDAAISADGRFIAFSSHASNLVGGDTNASADVFLHDRATGRTERVSIDSNGAQTVRDPTRAAFAYAGHPSLSATGRFVAFSSAAPNLVAGDSNAVTDVFVRDRRLGTTTLVSVGR